MEMDLKNSIFAIAAAPITAISGDGTTTGNTIETARYESLTFVFQTGTIIDGTHDVVLEEGDLSNMSDASPVAAADLLGAAPSIGAGDDDIVARLGYIGKKRYVRATIVSSSVTSGGTVAAVAILGHPQTRPTPG